MSDNEADVGVPQNRLGWEAAYKCNIDHGFDFPGDQYAWEKILTSSHCSFQIGVLVANGSSFECRLHTFIYHKQNIYWVIRSNICFLCPSLGPGLSRLSLHRTKVIATVKGASRLVCFRKIPWLQHHARFENFFSYRQFS